MHYGGLILCILIIILIIIVAILLTIAIDDLERISITSEENSINNAISWGTFSVLASIFTLSLLLSSAVMIWYRGSLNKTFGIVTLGLVFTSFIGILVTLFFIYNIKINFVPDLTLFSNLSENTEFYLNWSLYTAIASAILGLILFIYSVVHY